MKLIDMKIRFSKRFLNRKQQEDALRENHPYFDTPLFLLPRDSRFRGLCKRIVSARFCPIPEDPKMCKVRKLHFKNWIQR